MQNHFEVILALPEILLLILIGVVLIFDSFSKSEGRHATFLLTLVALLVVTVADAVQWSDGVAGSAFNGMYVVDSLSHFLKIASYVTVAATLIYGRQYAEERDMLSRGGELYTLSLLALLGEMVMISAGSLLIVYLGVELMSFSLYALIALRRENVDATEAAMKYFVLGALASGVLLYGLSMIYGATGELDLARVIHIIASGKVHTLPLVFGVAFIVAGLAFKLGAAPFHMWLPDVFQGAPTAVTLLVATAPKLAAIVLTLRLLIEGLHSVALDWQPMLLILAVLSLAVGNLTAIAQTDFKRMLAYSTIAHMGYVMLGLLSGVVAGDPSATGGAYGAALYYMIIYVLTTLITFGLIMLLSRKGFECQKISDLKGLNRRNPVLAGVLLLAMFSLAGIPPLAGFYAKLVVLQALVGAGHVAWAVVAVMFSLIGCFYYLRVVKMAYFDEPEGDPAPIVSGAVPQGLMSINGLALLVLGVLPGGLLALCVHAIQTSLGF